MVGRGYVKILRWPISTLKHVVYALRMDQMRFTWRQWLNWSLKKHLHLKCRLLLTVRQYYSAFAFTGVRNTQLMVLYCEHTDCYEEDPVWTIVNVSPCFMSSSFQKLCKCFRLSEWRMVEIAIIQLMYFIGISLWILLATLRIAIFLLCSLFFVSDTNTAKTIINIWFEITTPGKDTTSRTWEIVYTLIFKLTQWIEERNHTRVPIFFCLIKGFERHHLGFL